MPADPFCHHLLFIAPADISKNTCLFLEHDSSELHWGLGSLDVQAPHHRGCIHTQPCETRFNDITIYRVCLLLIQVNFVLNEVISLEEVFLIGFCLFLILFQTL